MLKRATTYFLYLTILSFVLQAKATISSQPRAFESFNVSLIQNLGSCSYTVVISTSCSSPLYTRDQISISFGDAYGNQMDYTMSLYYVRYRRNWNSNSSNLRIYAPRIDNPSSRAFERCSSDTFQINGPCAYQICYVYLYRTGYDGWMPDSVRIYGYRSRAVTYYYRTYIPGNMWYGFNYCNSASNSNRQVISKWFGLVVLAFVLTALS